MMRNYHALAVKLRHSSKIRQLWQRFEYES